MYFVNKIIVGDKMLLKTKLIVEDLNNFFQFINGSNNYIEYEKNK